MSIASWRLSSVQPQPKENKYQKLFSRSKSRPIRKATVRIAGLLRSSSTVTEWLAALDSLLNKNPTKDMYGRKTKAAIKSSVGILLCLRDLGDASVKGRRDFPTPPS